MFILFDHIFKDGVLVKSHMSTQISFESLQWLYYEQAKLDEKGLGTIDHAYHRGERTVYGKKVDGFIIINGKKIVYEYDGKFKYSNIVYISFINYSGVFIYI